jgi:hypothetical protein
MPLPHLPTLLRVGHGEQGYKERQDKVFRMHKDRGMSTHLGRFHQRFSDPLLTVLTLMLSFLLFGIGPMQASGIMTGQHFGYLF